MGHVLSKVGMLEDFEHRSGKNYQNLFLAAVYRMFGGGGVGVPLPFWAMAPLAAWVGSTEGGEGVMPPWSPVAQFYPRTL